MNMNVGEQPRWGPVDRSRSRQRREQEQGASQHENAKDREWEARRQELVADGGFFDTQGNVTAEGRKRLIASQWSDGQIRTIENAQRNHAAKVETVRPVEVATDPWEAQRRSAEQKGMFDEDGKLTVEAKRSLMIKEGWSLSQVRELERRQQESLGIDAEGARRIDQQRSEIADLQAERAARERAESAKRRETALEEARARAERELETRGRDQAAESMRGGRLDAGARAYRIAKAEGWDDSTAETRRRQAEAQFERDQAARRGAA